MIGTEQIREAMERAESIGDEHNLDGGKALLEHSGVDPDSIMGFCHVRVLQLVEDPREAILAMQMRMTEDQRIFAAHATLWIDGLLLGLQLGRMEREEDEQTD